MDIGRQETPSAGNEKDILKWCTAAVEEGDAFLKSQEGYSKFEPTIQAIMGEFNSVSELRPLSLASVTINHLGKIATDLTAAMTDVKPFWDYKTFNPKFEQQSLLGNKLALSWWTNTHQSLRLMDLIKYNLPMGSAYAHLVWDEQIEDQNIIAEDPRDVIPVRPASYYSIQDAMGVMIRRERTTNWVKSRWGVDVRPDRDASYSMNAANSRVSQLLNSLGMKSGFMDNLHGSLGGRPKAKSLNIPAVDVFTLYLTDDSTNQTGKSVWMGLHPRNQAKTNWSYEVKPNEPLYPRKRCIVFCRQKVFYDDTSIYWHGKFPCPKLTLDPWPWSWFGKAVLKDSLPLQAEVNRLSSLVAQHHRRLERPGVAADKNSISKAAMDRIDTSREGLKIRHNPLAGKGVELLHEPPLDASVMATLTMLFEQMDSLSGRRDLTQLMNLGQIPSMETVDKILETMSPSIRLRSQVLETFISELAMMVLSNFFQFYTKPQRVACLGPVQGVTFEDFDFDPDSLIPDMLDMGMKDASGNPLPRFERAREFIRMFSYHIAPGSLLASSGITEKMMYVQLFRMGVMDAVTLLEKLGVQNIGAPPDVPTGIMQRLQWQQSMGIGQTVSPAGRKASGQTEPRMKITESK